MRRIKAVRKWRLCLHGVAISACYVFNFRHFSPFLLVSGERRKGLCRVFYYVGSLSETNIGFNLWKDFSYNMIFRLRLV